MCPSFLFSSRDTHCPLTSVYPLCLQPTHPSNINHRAFFHDSQASNILPGRYNVSIVKKSLCWQVESVIVEASVDGVQDTPDIVFSQSGFRLSCDISHDTELNFEMEKEEKTEVGRFFGVCCPRRSVYVEDYNIALIV